MIAGKVLMDRNAPDGLLDTAASGYSESQAMNACFLLNSLSFLVVIATLLMLRVKHIPPAKSGPMREELRIGLSYVRHHSSLAALIVLANGGEGVDFLVRAVFNYPTFAEAYKVAALDATNKIRQVARYSL